MIAGLVSIVLVTACIVVTNANAFLDNSSTAQNSFTNEHVDVQTTFTPTNPLYLPQIYAPRPRILIAAAHIDSAISGEADEAIMLWNMGVMARSLAGWQLATKSRTATFPITSTLKLAPGARLWCTGQAIIFRQSFGEEPACEWDEDTDPAVLNLDGKLQLTNTGGWILLIDDAGQVIDTFVYGTANTAVDGWDGAAAQLYARGAIAASGQVWQRKRDPVTGSLIDNNRASDWASDLADIAWGRRVRYPGWHGWTADDLGQPMLTQADATVTVAVGPEGLYQPIADTFKHARTTIDLNMYTFEHPQLAQVLVDALGRGVHVRILLEGAPPGGIEDIQRWCLAQIAAAGGDIRYMAAVDEAPRGYRVRYRFNHAKYAVIDGQKALVGTENFNLDAIPVPSSEPVGGRRGFYLITDASPIIARLSQIFAIDWAPQTFLDLRPFDLSHEKYGGPPTDFAIPETSLREVKDAPFGDSVTTYGTAHFGVVSVPENALRLDAGLMALIARAGAGDEIMLTQLYEHKYWGDSTSNPVADPNLRLQALIDAARRGAKVRLLLDSFFDDGEALRSNRTTVDYVRTIAAAEGLPLAARLGNPVGGGIHAKILLVRLGEEKWSAVGSLNGGEFSHKMNREVVMLTDMAGVYTRLAEIFEWDWR